MSDTVNEPEKFWVVLSKRGGICSRPLLTPEEARPLSEGGCAALGEYAAEYVSLAAHEAALAEQGKRIAELEAGRARYHATLDAVLCMYWVEWRCWRRNLGHDKPPYYPIEDSTKALDLLAEGAAAGMPTTLTFSEEIQKRLKP